MTEDHADLLSVAGIDRVIFQNSGEDVEVVKDQKPVARVFRRGSMLVYRSGSEVWGDLPVSHS